MKRLLIVICTALGWAGAYGTCTIDWCVSQNDPCNQNRTIVGDGCCGYTSAGQGCCCEYWTWRCNGTGYTFDERWGGCPDSCMVHPPESGLSCSVG